MNQSSRDLSFIGIFVVAAFDGGGGGYYPGTGRVIARGNIIITKEGGKPLRRDELVVFTHRNNN